MPIPLLLPLFAKVGQGVVMTPSASAVIYEQQYRMHRFVRDFEPGRVAVNDLGLAAFRNEEFVLDLPGLASEEARSARARNEAGWVDRLSKKHGIALAMVYDQYLSGQIPDTWTLAARLHLGRPRVVVAGDVVSIYAVDASTLPAVLADLHGFADGLPDEARLEFVAVTEPR